MRAQGGLQAEAIGSALTAIQAAKKPKKEMRSDNPLTRKTDIVPREFGRVSGGISLNVWLRFRGVLCSKWMKKELGIKLKNGKLSEKW